MFVGFFKEADEGPMPKTLRAYTREPEARDSMRAPVAAYQRSAILNLINEGRAYGRTTASNNCIN
jgi:hypothetical protein